MPNSGSKISSVNHLQHQHWNNAGWLGLIDEHSHFVATICTSNYSTPPSKTDPVTSLPQNPKHPTPWSNPLEKLQVVWLAHKRSIMVTYSTHDQPPTLLLPGCPIPVPKSSLTHLQHTSSALEAADGWIRIANSQQVMGWVMALTKGNAERAANNNSPGRRWAATGGGRVGDDDVLLEAGRGHSHRGHAESRMSNVFTYRLVRSQDKWDGPKGMAAAVRARPWDDCISLTLKARMQGGREADLCCVVLCFPCGLVRGGGAASPPEAPPQTRSLFLADKVINPLCDT